MCTLNKANEKSYTLPDGKTTLIPADLQNGVPQQMFNPIKIGYESVGVHELVNNAISKCGNQVQPNLFQNIISTGGCSFFDGYQDKLTKEMKAINSNARIISQPDRNIDVFKGGSTLASLSNYDSSMISKQEYLENGNQIVHRKCH